MVDTVEAKPMCGVVKMENLFFSDKQLGARYDVHRTTIYRWVRDDDFPKPVKLSRGCTRWTAASILEWESKKIKA